jgi:hypothetical protein
MWSDGIHSEYGRRDEDGRSAQTSCFSVGTRGDAGERDRVVEEKTWFDPINSEDGCKDGFCPMPQFKSVDVVNHPPHYTGGGEGGIECIEAIEAQLTAEEYRGYLKGKCVKYLWRERHKGGVESLKKAQWYLNRLVKILED